MRFSNDYISVGEIKRTGFYDQIRIDGITGYYLNKDLEFYFSTSRISKYMFDKIGKNYVVFPSFFALEVLKIMDKIIEAPRKNYVSRRTAEQIKTALIEKTWVGKTLTDEYTPRLNLELLKHFKFQPLPNQRPLLDHIDRVNSQFGLRGTILDAVMGSGKTMMGLYVAECSEADVKIIITPKNALERVWVDTIQTKILKPKKIWRSDRGGTYKDCEYLVCHYESMSALLPMVVELKRMNRSISIVVDETHNFNERKSQRTKTLIEICQTAKSDFVVLQSGTPFKAIGSEIVPALLCIDPTFDENIAERFMKIYSASATEALELLRYRLGRINYKISKIDIQPPIIENFKIATPNAKDFTLDAVSAEMAQFVRERSAYYKERKDQDESIYLRIINEHQKSLKSQSDRDYFSMYQSDIRVIRRGDLKVAIEEIKRSNKYENEVITPNLNSEDRKIFKEVKTIYKYVALKIQGECLGRVLGKKRMECSVEIAKHLNYDKFIHSTGKKTLVYTVYVQALEAARDRLINDGKKPLVVYGQTNKNLNSIIADFEKDSTINPLVATFQSLSTAVPLTMADCMVMIDTPFRDYLFQQTVARINRIGTDTQTYVHIANLDTGDLPNMSTRTIDILKWSQSQIEKITGVSSPFEIDEKAISLEAYALSGQSLKDSDLIELVFEDAFMRPYE